MANNPEILICRISRRNLKWVLFWPSSGRELNPGKWYYIGIITFFVTTSSLLISVFLHLLQTINYNLDIPISEDLAGVISVLGVYYILLTFIFKRSQIITLLQNLSNFEKFGKPDGFDAEEKLLGIISNAIFVYSVCATNVYAMVKYLKKSQCEGNNVEKKLNECCGLIVKFWVPFDTSNTTVYWMVFFYSFFFVHLIFKPGLVIILLAYEITRHLILRIKHLDSMILKCFECKDYEICKKNLRRCILYHTEILNLSAELNACFSSTMFVHVALISVVCACLEKQFIDDDKICAALHFIGWILPLLLACVAGQILVNASETITETIWFSKWYCADVRLRKDIRFFLMRSQKNLHMTAGPLDVLSYPLFVSVLKMSYSVYCYLNV